MKIDQPLLEAALVGYLHQREEIAAKINEIQQQLSHAPKSTAGSGSRSHEMSAAARARIAAAQRKRWAEFHKSNGKKSASPKTSAKRVLSPAARKRIADATRKRWIAYRAQKAAAARSEG
jgi:hypothetical protein